MLARWPPVLLAAVELLEGIQFRGPQVGLFYFFRSAWFIAECGSREKSAWRTTEPTTHHPSWRGHAILPPN